MPSLDNDLKALAAQLESKFPSHVLESMAKAQAELSAQHLEEKALKKGGQAPDFTLRTPDGRSIILSEQLKHGPVVLVFYRGSWCPYCRAELKSYQEHLSQIKALQANVIAVSPEKAHGPERLYKEFNIEFPLLSDMDNAVAKAYGLIFELPDHLAKTYKDLGIDLSDANADGEWTLPIPAVYVINNDGTIVADFIDIDYKKRMDPSEVINSLKILATQKEAVTSK